MGQPVTVVKKESGREGVAVFELNRSITGMGHMNYLASPPEVEGEVEGTVADNIARELFQRLGDGLKQVHINSNILTLELANAGAREETKEEEIQTLLEDMFLHYGKHYGKQSGNQDSSP